MICSCMHSKIQVYKIHMGVSYELLKCLNCSTLFEINEIKDDQYTMYTKKFGKEATTYYKQNIGIGTKNPDQVHAISDADPILKFIYAEAWFPRWY